jgi:hypothetical protein
MRVIDHIVESPKSERAVRLSIERRPREKSTCFKIAQSREEWRGAFRLVYQRYLAAGLSQPNGYRMRVTPYQLLPTTEIFVAMAGGEVAATVSLVRDGKLGLPMEAIYGEQVRYLRRRGLRLGEVSCLADRRLGDKNFLPLVLRLMSLAAQCAERRGVDQLLIAVHPRHGKFFRRFAAFRPIGGLKTYEAVCGRPAVALALDLNRVVLDHFDLYKQFFGVYFSSEVFKCHSMSETIRGEFEPVVATSYNASAYADEMALAC